MKNLVFWEVINMSAPTLYLSRQDKLTLDAGFQAAFGTQPERYFSAPGRT